MPSCESGLLRTGLEVRGSPNASPARTWVRIRASCVGISEVVPCLRYWVLIVVIRWGPQGVVPKNGEWMRTETTLSAEGETMPAYLDSSHHRRHRRAQERTFRAGEAGPRSTQCKSCRGQQWPCQWVLPRASVSQTLGPQQPHTLGPGHPISILRYESQVTSAWVPAEKKTGILSWFSNSNPNSSLFEHWWCAKGFCTLSHKNCIRDFSWFPVFE